MKKYISLFLAVLMVFSIFPHITSVVNAADALGNITTSPRQCQSEVFVNVCRVV